MDPHQTMPHAAAVLALVACLGGTGMAFGRGQDPPQRTVMIDRVLAAVGGEIITLSDVNAVLRFELVPPVVTADPVQAVLELLIDRRLALAEVERYAPPEPADSAIDAGLADVQRRFADGAAFEAALSQSTMSRDELRRFVRDSLRIETYMEQRFATAAQPSEDEIVRYYKEHPSDFTINGALPPLAEIRARVNERLVAERRREAVAEWHAGLRRRGSVVVMPAITRDPR